MKLPYMRRGFTLIELLVVIAIIGILSSIVLASLSSARAKSRDAKRITDVRQLQVALELYYDANRAYPAALGTTATSPLTAGGYIATIPTDPNGGGSYLYAGMGATASTCTGYHLGATLEQANNPALQNDVDASPAATVCSGQLTGNPGSGTTGASANDFDGADSSNRYDVKP